MTRYVCELFGNTVGNTVNKKVKAPMWPEHPYGIDQLKRRVFAVPIKDTRKLELLWPCDYLHQWWESRVRAKFI